MSRVNEPCQSSPVFVTEPQLCQTPPARNRQVASEGSPHQRSREHLQKLGAKQAADVRALAAKLGEIRSRERNEALTDIFAKLVGHVAPDILFYTVPSAAAPAGCVLGPAGPIWMLLSGLSQIGRINHDVQVVSEQSARMRGFAETLGKALDEATLSPAQLQVAARTAKYPSHFAGLAKTELASVPARQREDYRKLAAAYAEGANEAVHVVNTLSADDRRQLALALAQRVDLLGTNSVDRLVGWFHLPR